MRILTRFVAAAAAAALISLGLAVAPASAGKPVEIGQCQLTINVPKPGAVVIPICWSGPPL